MFPAMFRGVFLKIRHASQRRPIYISSCVRNTAVDGAGSKVAKRMDDYYIDRRVQTILLKITGFDLEQIFRPKPCKLAAANYKYVTDEELANMQEKAKRKAYSKLQMPPVVEAKETEVEILSYDPELQGYERHNLLCIDISQNIPERKRLIVVREPDGTLRTANHKERFRMTQTFYPREGRSIDVPLLFESPYLDKLLDEGSYVFVLDKACVQFEPDYPEYHAVTKTTYEHIRSSKKFNELRSTRHFGPMSFYYAWNNVIEELLIDMIERELMEDASDLIKVLYIIHPELRVGSEEDVETKECIDVVKDFIRSNSSEQKPHLELAIQTYLDIQEHLKQKDSAETNASS